MADKVLMVLPKRELDLRDHLIHILKKYAEAKKVDLDIDKEDNIQEALIKCRKPDQYCLMVVHVHLADSIEEPLVEEDKLGLRLITQLAEKGCRVPAILLMDGFMSPDDQYSLQFRHNHIFPIKIDGLWEKSIKAVAVRAFDHQLSSDSDQPSTNVCGYGNTAQIDLFVRPHEERWEMLLRHDSDTPCDPIPIPVKVNMSEIKATLQKDSLVVKNRQSPEVWRSFLNDIGKVLVKEIVHNNPVIFQDYNRLYGRVNGCENIKIRFTTEEDTYPLNLEAILVPDVPQTNEFWMLKAPVCRRFAVKDLERLPLFEGLKEKKDPQEINCLIIQSNANGWSQDLQAAFPSLGELSRETVQLKDKLNGLKGQNRIGEIKFLPDKDTPCTAAAVKEVLTCGKEWHMVHYAGHSGVADDGTGYLIFPHKNGIEHIRMQFFALWLRSSKARLVYLSSCESATVGFAHELAQKGIPAAVGFRWPIDDAKAADHADIFYDNLFTEQSLEYAFLKTRQRVYEKDPEHIIWAASVLMMQALRN